MRRVLILGCLLAAAAGSAAAEQDLRTKFDWRQPLPGAFERGTLGRVAVPAEVYDGCRMFPADLRIINEHGEQWPFYVWTPEGRLTSQSVEIQLLNTSTAEHYVRQDIRIQEDPRTGARREHNQVIVKTPGRDFIRRVEVYGSEDGRAWAQLAGGYLVDHVRDVRVANHDIRYPVSTFPLLQVRVYPNARDATETVVVQEVEVQAAREVAGEWEEVALSAVAVTKDDQKDGCQVLVFDTAARNRPVERLAVRARDQAYARGLRVYGRNEATNAWRWLADGEIHRIGRDIQDEVVLRGSACRFLKLELYHYDDAPLDQVEVLARATPRYVVFEAQDGVEPQLYYGALGLAAPRFDLMRRKVPEDAAGAKLVRAGKRTDNELRQTPGWGRRGPWLAALAVGLVSLAVIWSVVGMLKKQSSQE